MKWNVGRLTEPVTGRCWDRPEIERQILGRMRAYTAAGIAPGDRVLILFGNRLEFFAELLAIWRLGGCAIPVDPLLTPFELQKLATIAQARFAAHDDAAAAATLEAVNGAILRNTLEPDAGPGEASEWKLPDTLPRLDDDALILFTSGSTGDPKGVVHTHRALLARWISHRENLGLERYRRALCVLPTHFSLGLVENTLFPWLAGCDLFIAPAFKADLVMQLGALVDEHQISFVSTVPSIWSLALRSAGPPKKGSLGRVHVAAAPLSAAMWRQIQEWTGTNEVLNAYGATETASTVAATIGGKVVPETGLVGKAWGATLKILEPGSDDDPLDAGAECEPGATGMVWLHTAALMKGYFRRQDLTDAVVRQGWFKTGDLGLIDDRGLFFLKGRERDEINKGGLKVYPSDVDEVVEQYPATRDVCTFAFEDDFYGENVGVAVVLEDRSDGSISGLYDWVRGRLAEHKHPSRWYLVDQIPRTSRGKVNRESVRQACVSATPLDMRALLRRHERSGDK